MVGHHSAAQSLERTGHTDCALLEQHRRDIEALDRRILHLVCERLELARQIGNIKGRTGVPLRNFEVETVVHRRFEDACRDLGLDPEVGRDLALFLIDKAVEEQATQQDTAYRGDALETLVVGGNGGMGGWFARFLRGQGHRVRIVDPSPGDSEFEEAPSLPAGVVGADLVVLAVPMSVCGSLIDELAELGTTAVVVEICSLKGHLAPTFEAARAAGLRLVSCHPLFGPDAKMLSGRTVVFCSEGLVRDRAIVRGLFESTSASLVELDIEEHDRRMGLVLGLTHLSNLVFARSLVLAGVGATEMTQAAGVTFRKQMATTREVSAENPSLYFEIQALNAITPETGNWLRQSLDEWLGAVVSRDEEEFSSLMTECRDYLESIGEGECRK
ncbi:MAG: prephenate dehydrogenase/arogenate dehydrogenase family protein [bacterium]|nr:prephenate dehydrogenase/arogenate dehydrogenase family protein [bacterium]